MQGTRPCISAWLPECHSAQAADHRCDPDDVDDVAHLRRPSVRAMAIEVDNPHKQYCVLEAIPAGISGDGPGVVMGSQL